MFNLFRKKKDPEILKIHSNLDNSFSRLGNDIDYIQRWLKHLHEKHEIFDQNHQLHIDMTKKDLDSLTKWVYYLNKHNIESKTYIKHLFNYIGELQKKDIELINYVKNLESSFEERFKDIQGHHGTLERTTKGQLKDMSFSLKSELNDRLSSFEKEFKSYQDDLSFYKNQLNEIKEKHQNLIVKTKEKEIKKEDLSQNSSIKSHVNSFVETKSSLSGSQLELLNVLYESDRPLSYSDLSKILNKKSKSIRNLIYELREAGVDIKSRFIGIRTKGFFLTKETKILVSGR
jgi:biotin operon repressor